MDDLISFPNLGINLHIGKSINIFGLEIAYYGIIIGIGMIVGALIAYHEARRTNQKVDDYMDFTIYTIIAAVIGARLYYVIFEWDYYKNNLAEIINIRNGGLAIYGGVIASVITLLIFARVKKLNTLLMMDTAVPGLIMGQVIGRWGNFCNREAFGGYYDGLFAMKLPVSVANGVTEELYEKAVDGYISVHPTFLYESAWNLVGFVIMMILCRHKKKDGEVFAFYLLWYGTGRAIIEGLRTDQLQIGTSGIAVSQVLSVVLAVAGAIWIAVIRLKKSNVK